MNEALLSSKKLDWCTPADFFKELDQEFHFELDPAATAKSAKCAEYFTPAEDGNPTTDAKGRPCSAPFPSAVVIWRSPDKSQSLRDMVLDLIKAESMTANEIAATLSDRGQQVSRSDVGPILTKAQAAGKAKNAGKRVCSVTGRSAIVWTAESEG